MTHEQQKAAAIQTMRKMVINAIKRNPDDLEKCADDIIALWLYTQPAVTRQDSPLMQTAEKARKTVEDWSDAKREYAASVTRPNRGDVA